MLLFKGSVSVTFVWSSCVYIGTLRITRCYSSICPSSCEHLLLTCWLNQALSSVEQCKTAYVSAAQTQYVDAILLTILAVWQCCKNCYLYAYPIHACNHMYVWSYLWFTVRMTTSVKCGSVVYALTRLKLWCLSVSAHFIGSVIDPNVSLVDSHRVCD